MLCSTNPIVSEVGAEHQGRDAELSSNGLPNIIYTDHLDFDPPYLCRYRLEEDTTLLGEY